MAAPITIDMRYEIRLLSAVQPTLWSTPTLNTLLLLYFVVRLPTSIRVTTIQYAGIDTCVHSVYFKGSFILLIF